MSFSSYRRLQVLYPKHTSATTSVTASFPAKPSSTAEPPQEIKELVRNFKRNSRKIEFRRRQDRYDSAVRRLAAGKHFSSIEFILEHQKQYKDSMSEQVFVVKLISLYGKVGMFNHARKVFDELPQYGCPVTVFTFNALLHACVKCNKIDEVGELFRLLPRKLGIEPNLVSYNTVIKGLCASHDFDSAMKVMEEMKERRIDPDIVSYNTMFDGYYKENKLEEADKLRKRMEEKGVIANVRTYNARLRGLIWNDQVQEAFELIEKMDNEVVKPDMYSYNIVITGCVISRKLEEAKVLYSKMVGGDCRPDHRTFGMLIPFACDMGDVDFAYELTKQAFELNIYVDKQLMQLVVNALTGRAMSEEADELVALVNSSEKYKYTIF